MTMRESANQKGLRVTAKVVTETTGGISGHRDDLREPNMDGGMSECPTAKGTAIGFDPPSRFPPYFATRSAAHCAIDMPQGRHAIRQISP
jgi:hypothetical protein